jgi:RNA polymerase sigma-70 factor (ECF subfamily)
MPEASSTTPSDRFPTTAWGAIQAAQDHAQAGHVSALNQVIGRYWKPVFCFLRARGHDLHRAEDLTQAFFLRFLERDWLQKADPDRGRFRTFLLTILVRFLSDQGPRRAPRQQSFEQQFVSIASLLGDEERSYEPPRGESAEAVFMKQWAAVLVATVRQRLRRLCEEKGRPTWYDLFDAVHGAAPGTEDPSQHALADRFGVTREQVRYGLEQVRQWFAILLRAEVREQVGSEADVGAEIRELLALLAN